MFAVELLIFFFSSLLILGLSYFKVSNTILQEITSFLLAALLILFSRGKFSSTKITPGTSSRLLLLFLSSFFVQLLVISTGGFFSPFLILLHLFTLGSSFLLGLKSSISFLIFSVLALTINNLLNPQMFALLREDPGSVLLYLLSFVVIIPLAQFLIHSYQFKDTLSKLLKEHLKINERREESILTSLSELILITDKSFNILSTNEAVEETLSLSASEVVHRPLLEILPLKDQEGKWATLDSLSLHSISNDRVSRIIKGISFQAKTDPQPRQVIIHARPVTNSTGEISQIVFIVTDAKTRFESEHHTDLEQARARQRTLMEGLKSALQKTKLWQSITEAELLSKIEDDIFIALEMEDHPVKENVNFPDIARLGKEAVVARQKLAKTLGVSLQFTLPPEEAQEASFIRLSETDFPSQSLPVSEFTVPTDSYWLKTATLRLLDLAILLASGDKNSSVQLTARRQDEAMLTMSITTPSPTLTTLQRQELFQEYYGDLGKITNLHLGSGLEGFIAKNILSQLNIPLEVTLEGNPPHLTFFLKFSKLPAATTKSIEKIALNS